MNTSFFLFSLNLSVSVFHLNVFSFECFFLVSCDPWDWDYLFSADYNTPLYHIQGNDCLSFSHFFFGSPFRWPPWSYQAKLSILLLTLLLAMFCYWRMERKLAKKDQPRLPRIPRPRHKVSEHWHCQTLLKSPFIGCNWKYTQFFYEYIFLALCLLFDMTE